MTLSIEKAIDERVRRSGIKYKTPFKKPMAVEPILNEIFEKQIELDMTDQQLQKKTGISRYYIAALRRPHGVNGKHPPIHKIRALADAVGMKLVLTLEKKNK